VTEESGEAADVAFQAACAMLIQGVHALRMIPPAFGARVRAIAAADVLLSPAGPGRGTAPAEVDEGSAFLETAYSRAAALLEADLPGPPPAALEVSLSQLDWLLSAMRDVAEEDLGEDLAGALALIGGAAHTLWAGVGLRHHDADTQRRMAAALGVLDPLALADFPEVRAAAAEALRELARFAHAANATSAATIDGAG
jgi:hypothetical protein